ncbi:MAG: MCE family protein, partial [Lentisphaerae bacterium]|nr:MCE family protein [Lentisphaerota bacterium]
EWFQKKYELEVVLEHARGLTEGDSVIVRGLPVGKVASLVLEEDRVHVISMMDSKPSIRSDYRASVGRSSILGGNFLEIDEGTDEFPELPDGMALKGVEPPDLVGDTMELVSTIKKGIIEEGVVESLGSSAELLNEVTTKLRGGEGSLGKLLNDDGKLYDDIAEGISALKDVALRMEKGEGSLGRLMTDEATFEELSQAISSLKAFSERLERSEGLLARLIEDEDLYKDIEEAVLELRAWIDDSRETSPVVSFTSILFGAF